MFALFSSPNPHNGPSGPRAIDLQLLPDEDILKIWDQSQLIMAMLEEKNIPTHMAKHYTRAVEKELQNRSQLKPNVFFKTASEQQIESSENDFTASKKPTSITNTILTTNILI